MSLILPLIINNFKADIPYKLVLKYIKPIYIIVEG